MSSKLSIVSENIKWIVLLLASLFMLLWVMFKTYSSENIVINDGVTETVQGGDVQQEVERTHLSAIDDSGDDLSEQEASVDAVSLNLQVAELDSDWGEQVVEDTESGERIVSYTHLDNSKFVITLSNSAPVIGASDFVWTHSLAASEDNVDNYLVSNVDSSDNTLCDAGDENCSVGNNQLDIASSGSLSDETLSISIQITETQADIQDVRGFYSSAIESIVVSR